MTHVHAKADPSPRDTTSETRRPPQQGRNLLRRTADTGFTLIELLVVITILGVLAAIVVFSVSGIGDKGSANAIKTDAQILRTAEESYCAQHGSYASLRQLRGLDAPPDGGVAAPVLASDPKYNGVVTASGTNCGIFAIGATAFGTGSGGIRFLAATDALYPMGFLAQPFVDANGLINFTPGGQGGAMAAAANELGFDPNNNPSGIPVWTPADTVLATADEQNLNKAIPSGTGMGIPGVCTVGPATSGGTQGSPTGATGTRKCTGVGTTKRQYAAGRLVVFSCSASAPLPPATKCNAPPGGYVSPVGQSQPIADIVAKFPAAAKGAVQAANNCSQPILALPYSGSATPGSITGASAAPYGLAAWQALTNFGTGGGGFVSGTEFNSLVGNQCIVIGKTLSDTEKIIREGGPAILTDQTANGTRTAQYALIPRGFVENPNGTEGQPAPVPANLHNPIALYIVVLKHGTLGGSNPATDTSQVDYDRGRAFVNFLLSPIGQAVFQAYGYDSPPAQSTV